MPVLASFGLHANQNIIGESLETGDPPWAIQLVDLLGAADTATVQRLRVPGFEHVVASGDPLAKERFGAKLTNHMKQLAPRERGPAWAAVQDCFGGVTVDKPTRMMCAADVAAAHAAGHEIGSHSYSHESMEHLDDAAFLEDFRNSCAALERAGCPRCAIYAFPNGSCRTGQSDMLVREGVSHVLLVGDQPTHPRAAVHTRVTVRGDSVPELRARAVQAPRTASRR
jgi:peptidoglycan/xylan/chitin deacetylase (PgdA/CDA1 family)